jgi:UDP-4-amino-4,6-dideoxy-N-acetyl-beta-L-altrosamine transaminase
MYIPYGRQNISAEDIKAVIDVLESDYLTQGPWVPKFEQVVADYCGAEHALAVNSATSALHVSCLALGVTSDDIVWTSPISFVASANCARYCGATVDFVDIDPKTYNISVEALADKLARSETAGTLPKVVIPVHLCGQPCDMAAIYELSLKYGFKIIEDASHAVGARYLDEPIGNCRFSAITVFSFHPVKIITTGEGGMALTNDLDLMVKMARLRSHGVTRDVDEMTHDPDGPWYYQQLELGYNYRMTDIQAALGVSQFQQLDSFISARHKIAARYDGLLAKMPVTLPWQSNDAYSAFHLYVVRLQPDGLPYNNHKQVFESMRAAGIGVNLHYIPIYKQPYYAAMGFNPDDFPEAEKYYQEAITLPIYPGLTEAQQDDVVKNLRSPIGYQTLF